MQKIKSIDALPYRSANGCESLLVRVESDGGIIGVGEATLFDRNNEVGDCINAVVAPDLIGRDLSCANYIESKLFSWHNASAPLRHAYSGVEIACWDALGKSLGLPIYKLLGGKALSTLHTTARVGSAPVECHAERIVVDIDEHICETMAQISIVHKVSEKPLIVDLRGTIPEKDLFQILRFLEKVDPYYTVGLLNEDNTDMWSSIAKQARIPLAARVSSRFDASSLIEDARMSIVEADILKVGGIGAMKLLASYAETYYIKIASADAGGSVTMAAAAHALYTCANAYGVDHPKSNYPELVGPLTSAIPGEAPGLGIEIDWNKLYTQERNR